MKTSGIVALAIVVASMEVADAKCYVGFRSGMWQGAVSANVQGGMVYVPTATARKIMIRGFRTDLGAAANAFFYGGLVNTGMKAALAALNTGGGPQQTGTANTVVYLKFDGTTNAVAAAQSGEVTLDLGQAVQINGFNPTTDNAEKIFWLSLSVQDGSAHHASFDFTPHFRGGWLRSLKYSAVGRITSAGHDDTEILQNGFAIHGDSDAQTVWAFVGMKSWAESRDVLDIHATADDPAEADIRHFPTAGATQNQKIDATNLLAAATTAGGVLTDIANVKMVKWFALHNIAAGTARGIVAYVEA